MRRPRFFLVLAAVTLAVSACSGDPSAEDQGASEDDISGAPGTVGHFVQHPGNCSTGVVRGLAEQVMQEVHCMKPGVFSRVTELKNLRFGKGDVNADGDEEDDNAEILPLLQVPAALALAKIASTSASPITLTSAFRTMPQQFLLYQWRRRGACGLGLVAQIGKSTHESGLAVDIRDHAAHKENLTRAGFRWKGARDSVHFDYVGPGILDVTGIDVLAFQRLWNRNNPKDVIVEDGEYGPATRDRMAKTPVAGFPLGASCEEEVPTTKL